MNQITLDVQSFVGNGTADARLLINGHDVGVLYLTDEEREILIDTLRTSSSDVDVRENLPVESNDFDFEDDLE